MSDTFPAFPFVFTLPHASPHRTLADPKSMFELPYAHFFLASTWQAPGVQGGLVITLDLFSFLLFVLQRPFIDRFTNFDVGLAKFVALVSFILLLSDTTPEAAGLTIIANLVVLYWMVIMQLFRQLFLMWQVSSLYPLHNHPSSTSPPFGIPQSPLFSQSVRCHGS